MKSALTLGHAGPDVWGWGEIDLSLVSVWQYLQLLSRDPAGSVKEISLSYKEHSSFFVT